MAQQIPEVRGKLWDIETKRLIELIAHILGKGVTKISAERNKYEEELIKEIKDLPEEYFPNLLQIVHLFKASVTLKTAKESFRQGWKEVKEGKTKPLTELWEGINAE